MVKFLISRPISVLMVFTALFILGIITYLNIPVSLLPDIAIPEITIQVTGGNTSARELENTVVSPIRQQLLQLSKLRDIRTETRDGSAILRLAFEYGANTDLAFIEVNEKIDAAMNFLPRETERPRVIKASVTDIPVQYLMLTLREDTVPVIARRNDEAIHKNNMDCFVPRNDERFMELSEFAETVIKRRIEQLPQVAMVDISGMMKKQVVIIPDKNLLEISGISLSDLEATLNSNNVEPGSMTVRDGYYEYNIRFFAVLRTIEDIRNIYIRKNDRIYQLKDLAKVELVAEKENGMVLYNGKRAVALAIIKQSEENMENMQQALNKSIKRFQRDYPEIEFSVSQNQTELLDYSISNLKQNLLLAFIFVCLVSFFFMNDLKSPLIMGVIMFVSLVITFLFFYLFHISLNVVSLTGLILALGMMIDNSIIVTDNVTQYLFMGYSVEESCIRGTNEVIAPILSSSLTTIAVFFPLVYLSGIAGAIFFDQAFSVTAGLFVSYLTGIMLLPVICKLVYPLKTPGFIEKIIKKKERPGKTPKLSITEKAYNAGGDWTFSHKRLTTIFIIAVFPLCFWLFQIIPKEKMPKLNQSELIAHIEWNENIHVEENEKRCNELLDSIRPYLVESSALIAQQQFLLNRERELTSTETEIYLRTVSTKNIPVLKEEVNKYLQTYFPLALVSFSPMGTVFEKIFSTGEPDLVVEYYKRNKTMAPDAQTIRQLENNIWEKTGEKPAGVSFQKQLNLSIDREKLLLYKVSYDEVYRALKTAFKDNRFATLRSYQQYLPIVLGGEEKTVKEVIENTLVTGTNNPDGTSVKIPLSVFVSVAGAEDLKTIVAGKSGEYIPLEFYGIKEPEKIMQAAKEESLQNRDWDVDFSGSFFANKKMINELLVILLISILLMYFILAAQFENFLQPVIVLLEIPIDICASLALLLVLGYSLNLMSAIGLVVSCGIIINDSILKMDMMNQLRASGMPLMEAIHEAGRRRLKAIVMTSLTSIVCMAPLFWSNDLGAALEKPLAIGIIGGMVIGTPVSLFVVPLLYWRVYKTKS
ncbi:MAG: efflux RND transporter permease subunit [Candidatus Azobacteroides sp.]|nr:efflux RND transporter permease subunit [Candidatus Azobacteroides sp.]